MMRFVTPRRTPSRIPTGGAGLLAARSVLAAPARGQGTARGRFARVLGLARNPIRAGLSALIVVVLVYRHFAKHPKTVRR
jgi:hypothetical protein